jgi:hypothetical protein
VLTVTPGGASVVVLPVDVDVVFDGLAGSVVESVGGAASLVVSVDVVVGFVSGFVSGLASDSGAVEFGADPEVFDCEDSEDDSDDGVSAVARHAPLTKATPIPSATANSPTRPTYAAAFMGTCYTPGPEWL